jgi:hypothetical protein
VQASFGQAAPNQDRRRTVSVSVATLPAASLAVIVMTFVPRRSGIDALVQFVVPLAVPFPPRSLAHVICVTPTLSALVPVNVMDVAVTVYVDPDVGPVIVTVGAVVSVGGAVDIDTVNTSFARFPAASRA